MTDFRGGIAFFDSGIGGLTVLAECCKYVKDEIFYYYGDNEHAPYGNLPPEKIRQYVLKAFQTFARMQVRAVVLACNTATALCVDELRQKYDVPIIGAEPAVFSAAKCGGEVFALTTRATAQSPRFLALCERAEKEFPVQRIRVIACDGLAGAIEKNLCNPAFDYKNLLPRGNPDAVVLGCTHYVYCKQQIRAFYQCDVFDGNEGIAKRLCALLGKKFDKRREWQPPITPNSPQAKLQDVDCCQNVKKYQEKACFLTNINEKPIVFIGNAKESNKQTFKQMFVKWTDFQ